MSDKEKSPQAKKEEEILAFWEKNKIFEKTLEKESPCGDFIFYEGPPTANGRPGIHHLESRSFKDAIPRYKTMRGFHVRRKAGWDTHGLPVEIEVEKQLGIKSKNDIEEYGVEKFNEKCKESVWKYVEEWERFTRRIGYWLDLDNPYVTYEPYFMESVWNILSHVDNQDLLYKDYKVLPWCPRCGTALSSHELAQGYKEVKDLSVTARFKLSDEFKGKEVSVLAWTTTPWTLPGNVALAVGKDISYGLYEVKGEEGNEYVICAQACAKTVLEGRKFSLVEQVKASELIGLSYEPLYPYLQDLAGDEFKEELEKSYKIYDADFVTTEDGTGVVHTAVMYGQDDFVLGTDVGLPKFHLVDEEGHFVAGTDFLEGRFVKEEETDVEVIKNLAHRGLLFDKAKYEHTYPHCWRCKTPLIYYARDSWYIAMSKLKDELISENEKINWEPTHLKHGRFGEWLEGVRDWAVSRDRYWGTPLPVWENEDGTKRVVIGSIEELKEKTKSSNSYVMMRHGEADHNVANILNIDNSSPSHVTEKGKKDAERAANELADKVDIIYHSPLVRAKETADIIASKLGIKEVVADERLGEFDFGSLAGKSMDEYHAFRKENPNYYRDNAPQGENFLDVKRRIGEFLYEIDEKHVGKSILIITHGVELEVLPSVLEASGEERFAEIMEGFVKEREAPGEYREFEFSRLPHNRDFELDLHRPYIDEITFKVDGEVMKRTPEVIDVWFDSGAMPFAQDHYPFENKAYVEKTGFPADYISEAIDQTRGWFYTLHAIGVLMGKGHAYKNIISLGHLLDAEGQKMSKSKGNTVDPWEAADEYGVDALRFWMYSINQPGESKNFDGKTVDEIVKKVFNILRNVVRFWNMYRDEEMKEVDPHKSGHVLDRWILSRLSELTASMTSSIEAYNLIEPTRAIRDFIGDDLSRWYIRRSRDRFKGDDKTDRAYALATTRYVLEELAKLLAPFTPFIAEEVYGEVGGNLESVHLETWPQAGKVDDDLNKKMYMLRKVVSRALDVRAEEGIKVRQPLGKLVVDKESFEFSDEMIEEIKDEVNVKEVVFEKGVEGEVKLDTELSDELIREGQVREFIRGVQSLRKKEDLEPQESIVLSVDGSEDLQKLIKEYSDEIQSTAGIASFDFKSLEDGEVISLDEEEVKVAISK